ncbi:unnamed protein product [Onchocerca flexuosa]|uniref:Cysteine rich repeat-containing domain protein n=1 Tax=Onchocerca flexuosa TaxID=387005 RepID=A0A183I4E3_9BILA|nr:unnamed protein product [Onchocerca flexuosa]
MCHNMPSCNQSIVSQSQHVAPVQLQQSRCVANCMPNCEPQCIQQACPPACQPMCELECMHKLRSQVIVLEQQESQLPQFPVQPHLIQFPSQPQLPRFPFPPVQPSVHALRPPPQPRPPQTRCVQQCMPQCLQECVRKACIATCGPACLSECMEQQKKLQSPQGCSCMIGYTHCSQNTCCLRRRQRHVS